jgi:hypothetical protein
MSKQLSSDTRRLITIILVGGPLVLISYTLVFVASPEMRVALWGGVPDDLRGLYTYSMFGAAAGFFPFTYAFLSTRIDGSLVADHKKLTMAYSLVLFPSAAWLPLTMMYLDHPTSGLWYLVRMDLFGVAAGALLLAKHAVGVARTVATVPTYLGVLGALLFAWQTVGLDALAWPSTFSR